MILTTLSGVPIIVTADEAIILTNPNTQNVIAAELDMPGSIDEALQALKCAVAYATGIDPALSDNDWYEEFMAALTITQYAEAVQVLFHARHEVNEMEAHNADA